MAEAIWLANPRGFCAGVVRAIEIVELLLERHGPPIYVKHEVVHNRRVIEGLAAKGVRFIEDPKAVPKGSILVFSAHGVSQRIRSEAERQGLQVHDATCPLVTKVHAQVRRMRSEGCRVLMIGHSGHPEVEGTMGQVDGGIDLIESVDDANGIEIDDTGDLAYVTQTTLSVDETAKIIAALRSRFPAIRGPAKEDICYATTNRQAAVRAMAGRCDLVLVVGSANSSNSNRLRELAERHGCPSHLIDDASDIRPEWLEGRPRIGITAGASAPEEVVAEVVEELRGHDPRVRVEELGGVREDVVFSVPKALVGRAAAGVGP